MNKIWKKLTSLSKGQKAYLILWIITGIILISFIAVAVAMKDDIEAKIASAQNSIAIVGILFTVSLIASVFTTVAVSVARSKAKGAKK